MGPNRTQQRTFFKCTCYAGTLWVPWSHVKVWQQQVKIQCCLIGPNRTHQSTCIWMNIWCWDSVGTMKSCARSSPNRACYVPSTYASTLPCWDLDPHYFRKGWVIIQKLKIQCGPCGDMGYTYDQVGTFLRVVPTESAWSPDSENIWFQNRSPQSVPTRKLVFLTLPCGDLNVPTRLRSWEHSGALQTTTCTLHSGQKCPFYKH